VGVGGYPYALRMATNQADESESRFECSRCGTFSYHIRKPLMVSLMNGTSSLTDQSGHFRVMGNDVAVTKTSPSDWNAKFCSSCNTASVWRLGTRVYPFGSTGPSPHPDMPEAARELYEEASLVLPSSRRAAAALARASLESLLKEVAPSSAHKNLQSRVGALRGSVNESLWKLLTALRVVGNDSLHGDQDELVIMYLEGAAAEVVEPFFGAINSLVEELITQPRKAQELYDLIPAAKREAAERAGQ